MRDQQPSISNQTNSPTSSSLKRNIIIVLQKFVLFLTKYWIFPALMSGVLVLALALLAPAYMASEQPTIGQVIYRFLSLHDHQLPQRSYFLFAETGGIRTYAREQLLSWGADPQNLRAFVGNAKIGYKMGLNHRMTAIFTAFCLGGLIWHLAGERPRLRWVPFLALAFPMLLDSLSHMNSDTSDGFRQVNIWAFALTDGSFPKNFYTGTTIGTLNWLLRTITGFIFGLGLVWFLFTELSDRFFAVRRELEPKLRKAGIIN